MDTTYRGVGFFGLLGIVFIALKLTEYIDWSWWWVLAPLWMPTALGLALLIALVAWCRRKERGENDVRG